ncbi:MAG: protein kinase [Halofilum sp. (in: g-proteobacteria)]
MGQCSDQGRKPVNQDFHGLYVPDGPQRGSKGIAIALADGIGSSEVSQIASETAVRSFLEDYFCTSDAWSVKKSAQRVLMAINHWLHSHTRNSRYCEDQDRGYVCTVSTMVLKSTVAHIFHVGDSRIYRVAGRSLEQLTEDHRVWLSRHESYLGRALGVKAQVEIDYRAVPLDSGDVFVLATDGVYEHVTADEMTGAIAMHESDLDEAARHIVSTAYDQGSTDNLTVQILRVDQLATEDAGELHQRLAELAIPPELEPRTQFDGYEIVRKIHASTRSHVYLARERDTGALVALKTPSTELAQDPIGLERFLLEEWVARRIDNPHVLKPHAPERKRSYLYVAMEYVEGQSLTQWMRDHPKADIERVRALVEQVARGLRAFHRQEMLHRDLRPDNILIDSSGTAKIADFGSTRVAGIAEASSRMDPPDQLGTEQYSAPEYFMGEEATDRSDIFSLGVVTYQMLTGQLPYGTAVAQVRTRAGRNKLRYSPVFEHNRAVPAWINGALRQAVHPDPERRYEDVDELVHDLRHPRKEHLHETRPPLVERNPELFWKSVSAILALTSLVLVVLLRSQ